MNHSPVEVNTYRPAAAATTYRPPRPTRQRTICVLGVPRGGTSMVAGVLAQLGVDMGAPANDPNQEDHSFLGHNGIRDLFTQRSQSTNRKRYIKHARIVAATRDRNGSVWGWKDPLSSYYIRDLHPALRNPHYIVVTRDPSAVATREAAHDPSDDPHLLTLHMRSVLAEYASINEFVQATDAPTLVVSYERALRAPRDLVRGLQAFVDPGESLADDTLQRIADYIQPDRGTAQVVLTEEERMALDASLASSEHRQGKRRRSTTIRDVELGSVAELALTSVAAPEVNIAEATTPASATLFTAAADHLLVGHLGAADALAARALLALTDQAPVVSSGPEACAAAAHEADARTVRAADILVGCYNVRGLVALRRGDWDAARVWFGNGHQIAAAALSVDPTGHPVCDDLVWWTAFHAAVASKSAGHAAWSDFVANIGAHPFNPGSAAAMQARVASELMGQSAVAEGDEHPEDEAEARD